MAKIESILGKVSGTVGSMTFRRIAGTRSAISSKVTAVTNPKSIAQCAQRMKVRPAELFYSAFESVLNHSREGVKIGADHRRAFLAETMKQSFNGCPYVVKGTSTMVPGLFPMSKGNLRGFDVLLFERNRSDSSYISSVCYSIKCINVEGVETVAEFTQKILAHNPSLQEGNELTFVTAVADHNGEGFYPVIQYLVLNSNDNRKMSTLGINIVSDDGEHEGFMRYAVPLVDENDTLAGSCIIVSRKVGKKWKYSTTNMELKQDWRDELFSTARYEAALASYGASGVNAVNSPFILQQSTNQPYNGRVAAFDAVAELGPDGGKELVPARFVAAIRANVTNTYDTSAIIAVFVDKTSGALIGTDGGFIEKQINGQLYRAKPDDIAWTGQTMEWNASYLAQLEN